MFKVSCIQLRSNDNIKDNLKKTESLIKKAINQGADLILTPEVSSLLSLTFKTMYLDEQRFLSKGNKKFSEI